MCWALDVTQEPSGKEVEGVGYWGHTQACPCASCHEISAEAFLKVVLENDLCKTDLDTEVAQVRSLVWVVVGACGGGGGQP